MKVSLKLKKIDVEMDTERGQEVWTLRQLDGLGRDAYVALLDSKVEKDVDGKPTRVLDQSGIQSGLLCQCLCKPDGSLATKDEVDRFPADAQVVLFLAAKQLSGLIPGDPGNAPAASGSSGSDSPRS